MITSIQKDLLKLKDKKYAEFVSKLIPTIDKHSIIGVRIPQARKLAKQYIKQPDISSFLDNLPHKYCDENILHTLIINEIKDYDLCLSKIEAFLPYIDNWAVCDSLSPKIIRTNKKDLLERIPQWIQSNEVYTCRFGLKTLMTFFLDDDFKEEYLKLASKIYSEEYYVNMMIAWFFATALAKQWDSTIIYVENKILNTWVHNKAIQKACESRRITKTQKEYLKNYKIK